MEGRQEQRNTHRVCPLVLPAQDLRATERNVNSPSKECKDFLYYKESWQFKGQVPKDCHLFFKTDFERKKKIKWNVYTLRRKLTLVELVLTKELRREKTTKGNTGNGFY